MHTVTEQEEAGVALSACIFIGFVMLVIAVVIK